MHDGQLDIQFFLSLVDMDEELTTRVQAEGCPHCDGALHRADYPRKPRGIAAELAPAFAMRHSLCCSAEGCRRRCTPPSVRFLGRRVYVGAVLILCCVVNQRHREQGVAYARPTTPVMASMWEALVIEHVVGGQGTGGRISS